MELNYEEVPNIISCKDLDYLSDMFNWTYTAYKNTDQAVKEVEDEELKDILERASDAFFEHLGKVLSILQEGGIEDGQE